MDNWTQVHEQYGPLVWATVYRVLGNETDALDCCQDVFVEASQSTKCREVKNWPAFLRWLATRRALDRFRKRRMEAARFDSNGDVESVVSTVPGPDDEAVWHELIERLKLELTRLPDRQDEVFWLRTVEELSYEEIAEQLGTDVNQVGVLLHRARQKIRQWLADLDPLKQQGQ
jgi:RNA polymerase sigma-70 factor, ECF subfamily